MVGRLHFHRLKWAGRQARFCDLVIRFFWNFGFYVWCECECAAHMYPGSHHLMRDVHTYINLM
jgi:hypothetical protein